MFLYAVGLTPTVACLASISTQASSGSDGAANNACSSLTTLALPNAGAWADPPAPCTSNLSSGLRVDSVLIIAYALHLQLDCARIPYLAQQGRTR